jgi:hypothetical protein
MVLDETEDQSLTEVIESHAYKMAKSIREEQKILNKYYIKDI